MASREDGEREEFEALLAASKELMRGSPSGTARSPTR
jgi:hypothetical protein